MRTNSLTDEIQAVVNQRLWKFVEQHGGVRTVATKLGLVPQTLYNVRDNRTFPSAGTLALIKQEYPNTDINAFLRVGDEPETFAIDVSSEPLMPPDVVLMQTILTQKEAELKAAREKIDRLEEEIKQANREFRQLAINFPASSSQTTDYLLYPSRMEIHGFRPAKAAAPAGPLNILAGLGFSETKAGWVLG